MTAAAPTSRLDIRRRWPAHTGAVALGYVCSGASMLVFFAIASRSLTSAGLASVAVTWTVIVLAGGCLISPIEREIARRTAARQANNPRLATLAAALTALAAAAITAAIASPAGVAIAAAAGASIAIGTTATAISRGRLAGQQRFRAVALVTGSEGVSRLALLAVLAAAGEVTPTTVIVALGVAALATGAAAAAIAETRTGAAAVGAADASRLLPVLVAASILSQLVLHSPVLIAERIGASAVVVSTIAIVLMVGRVPLYLFQAVQTTLLPHLSRLIEAGDQQQARTAANRMAATCALAGTGATIAAAAIGPPLVSLFYGPSYRPTAGLFALVGVAATAALIAFTLGQLHQAQRRHTTVLAAWAAATACGIAVALAPIHAEFRALGSPAIACVIAAWVLVAAERFRPSS
jgi:O-antigen/teichoic acid export membrane protein